MVALSCFKFVKLHWIQGEFNLYKVYNGIVFVKVEMSHLSNELCEVKNSGVLILVLKYMFY